MDDRPSTLQGTTNTLFFLAVSSVLGGLAAGIACFVHTADSRCDAFGCASSHPLVVAGLVSMAAGIVQACVFLALGLIARAVGEMHAAQLGITALAARVGRKWYTTASPRSGLVSRRDPQPPHKPAASERPR